MNGSTRRWLLGKLLTWQGWMDAPESRRARMWGAAVTALSAERHGPGSVEQFQPVLPRLPVPKIDDTLRIFTASVDPLLDAAGRAELRSAVDIFRASDVVARLQARLQERHATQENWLADYWERYAYLIDRRSLIHSVGYALDAATLPRTGVSQLQRAAMMGTALLALRRRIADGGIRPQRVRGVVPLCMKQLRSCFATVRLPGDDVDTIRRFDDQRCIIVLVDGHLFEVEVLFDDGTRDISYAELLAVLTEIRRLAAAREPAPPIAALTLQQRDVWARVRAEIVEGGGRNADNLDRIERALFILVLDDEAPEGMSALGRAMLCGNGANRWLDKGMEVVVFRNGRMGGLMEHSRGDGEAVTLLLEEMLLHEGSHVSLFAESPLPAAVPLRHLDFEVAPGSPLGAALQSAAATAKRLIADVEVSAGELAIGAGAIKAQHCSPDSFLQLAFQLAYARLHPERKPCLAYQTATTRLFAAGRTECLRSASAESIAFVESMADPEACGERRRRLLRAALDAHRAYRMSAMRGRGCDRHLFGLLVEAMLSGADVELFRTTAWNLPFELSTSQSPVRQTAAWRPETSSRGVGFLPLSQTGYGVSYAFVGDERTYLLVSASAACPDTSAQRFRDAVDRAVRDMLAVASGHEAAALVAATAGRS